MTKLWNKFLAPSSIGGQSLLQKDGPKSDLFNDQEDDDSSSLSEREPRAKRSASKRLFRTRILRSKTVGEEDGYGALLLSCEGTISYDTALHNAHEPCTLSCFRSEYLNHFFFFQNLMPPIAQIIVHDPLPHPFSSFNLDPNGDHFSQIKRLSRERKTGPRYRLKLNPDGSSLVRFINGKMN